MTIPFGLSLHLLLRFPATEILDDLQATVEPMEDEPAKEEEEKVASDAEAEEKKETSRSRSRSISKSKSRTRSRLDLTKVWGLSNFSHITLPYSCTIFPKTVRQSPSLRVLHLRITQDSSSATLNFLLSQRETMKWEFVLRNKILNNLTVWCGDLEFTSALCTQQQQRSILSVS